MTKIERHNIGKPEGRRHMAQTANQREVTRAEPDELRQEAVKQLEARES
jgi:hypothetical protein